MSGYKLETHPVTRMQRRERIAPNVTLTIWGHYNPQAAFDALCHMTQAEKYRYLYGCTYTPPSPHASTFVEVQRFDEKKRPTWGDDSRLRGNTFDMVIIDDPLAK